MTRARTTVPETRSICACGSMKFQKALGNPVLLNPSTVINIPQKKTKSEYETCGNSKKKKKELLNFIEKLEFVMIKDGQRNNGSNLF